MTERRTWREILAALSLTVVAVCVLLLAGGRGPRRAGESVSFDPLPATSAAAGLSPWGLAARKVAEDRGEPTGRQAKVEVPGQLRHYSDTRRFLAIQVAEWREHRIGTPHDYAGLAEMIRGGELVEVPTVAESYVLFGVGGSADGEPFAHYDKSEGESISLFDEAELERERARMSESTKQTRGEIDSLRRELNSLGRAERSRRASLRAEITRHEKTVKEEQKRKVLIDAYYDAAASRHELSAEREALAALAGDFSGRRYDVGDARARREMKVRMLSHLRPEALAVLKEIAESYRLRFGRQLPVTSLVRPDEYQRRLSATNANATRIDTPPHSTGLAFDILYRHMTAEEQAHVMADIARLRDAGCVEALRENRDHFHVFAFIDGKRPGEDLIRESLGHSAAAKPLTETTTPATSAKKAVKIADRRVAKKDAVKRTTKTAGRKRR